MSTKLFLSHDHRDSQLAHILGQTISRITLGQLEIWFSSDQAPGGGMQPGRMWLDEIRQRLNESKAVLALLTPFSVVKPWILFESGIGAAHPGCEVIPICIGINPQSDVPFPLAMYQCYQLADYESLKTFIAKLLRKHEVNFDEEMAAPLLKKAINELTLALSSKEDGLKKPKDYDAAEVLESLKQHIDRRFFELVERQANKDANLPDASDRPVAYTVKLWINFPNLQREQYLEIESTDTVQDVLNNVFYMIESEVQAFTYLEDWMLVQKSTRIMMIMREITARVPAKYVFAPGAEWEAVKLKRPYNPADSDDLDRWYRS